MNKGFTDGLIQERDKKLTAITEYFQNKALEGHIFGSLNKGNSDALSDIDIWLTFKDEDINQVIDGRFDLYNKFGKVVMFHEAQQNFPLNGVYSLIIYETPLGLLQIDYYLCPLSSSRIIPDSTVLFEKVSVQRGEMLQDPKRVKRPFNNKVSFVICMCFVGIKKVVRKDKAFIDFLVSEYSDIKARMFTELPTVSHTNSSETIKEILANLNRVATPEQQKGIKKIREFMEKVDKDLVTL